MSEVLPNEPEDNSPLAKKRFEAACIARVTGLLYEAFHGSITGRDCGDWALDEVHHLCESIAKRDTEMGRLLIIALETHEVARGNQQISDTLRQDLGLPPNTFPYEPNKPPIPHPLELAAPEAEPRSPVPPVSGQ
jgi:hypothetical protein